MDSERLFLAGLVVPLLAINFCRLSSKELSTQTSGLEPRLGQQALELAARLASPKDTGSAIAAVSRELDRVMLRLQSGAAKAEDQVAAARRRRDEKRRAAAEAREA